MHRLLHNLLVGKNLHFVLDSKYVTIDFYRSRNLQQPVKLQLTLLCTYMPFHFGQNTLGELLDHGFPPGLEALSGK